MAEDLAKKKRVRAGHRASATRMANKAGELLSQDSPDATQLAQLRLSLQEKLDVLKQLDGEVLDLVSEDHVAEEIEQSDRFKEDIYLIMVRIEHLSTTDRPAMTPAPSPALPTPAGQNPPSRRSEVKLPKLTIQPFNGDLIEWMTFWDSYQAAIHRNSALSDIDKFNYLRSLLRGSALDAVAGLTLTAANYDEALSVLEKRFGNKQRIVARHMETLLNVDPVTSTCSLKALRQLYDTVEVHVRGLRSLGVPADSYGSLLSSLLLNKLPSELRLILSRKVGDSDWKLDQLMTLLEEEIRARERAVVDSATPPKKPTKIPSTAAALLTGGADTKPLCCYCQQPHYSNSCKAVQSAEERKRILRDAGRCYVCLRRGHISRQCRSHMRCSYCHNRHHSSICQKGSPQARTKPRTSDHAEEQHSSSAPPSSGMNPTAPAFQPPASMTLWTCANQTVLLQTAQAVVFNPDNPQRAKQVRIVLDIGSQRSYMTKQLRQELALDKRGEQSMSIITFGSRDRSSRVCEVVHVGLKLRGGQTKQLSLFVVPLICEPLVCQPVALCQERFQHLSGLTLADSSDDRDRLEVDILIGSDQYWSLITGRIKRGDYGPVGVETELGWVLSGSVGLPAQDPTQATLVTHTLRVDGLPSPDNQTLDDCLKSFWDLDSFGIIPEHSVLDDFHDKVRFIGGRYEVSLPWKESHQLLPDNYQLCLRRLWGLVRRLQHDPEVFKEYDSIIQSQLHQGIVEFVDWSKEEQTGRIHYLPHHAVIRQDKDTTRIRVVYDASARSGGPSLNDCLHTGPKFNQRIFDLLLRFRVHRVALTADIEKAFLMVLIAKEDREVLRFLWVDDITKEQPKPVELRFTRAVFGVSSSPFLLNATIRHHLEHSLAEPSIVEKMKRAFYVDDVVTGAENEAQAYQLYRASKEIMKAGGFNLRKFCSNSALLQIQIAADEAPEQQVQSHTEEAEESYASSTLGCNQEVRAGERKVLGVPWNIATDQLVLSLDSITSAASDLEPTKRVIVSIVAKLYDPLGLLSPVVVQLKIFIQELCEAKLDWDQQLTGQLLERWRYLSSKLLEARPFLTPRCYFDGIHEQVISYRLCGFCDASIKAYAAVVYLLVETPSERHVRITASKTRVSPLKTQTIPRLELLSTLLLARLMVSITQALMSELPLSEPHCFSDSTVAIFWIRGVEKTWKPFVQNRALEIRKLMPPECWTHCSGQDNPADIPSRGHTPQQLSDSQLWMNGPEWLKTGDLSGSSELQMPDECRVEMKADKAETAHGLLTTVEPTGIGQLMKGENVSSFGRLVAITANVLKFCRLLLNVVRPGMATAAPDDLAKAEILWVVESQRMLVSDKNFPQWKRQFDLFQDNHKIWRCGGRIQNADLPFTAKHPALLAKDHFLSALLVRRAHERVFHSGVKATLTELRSHYWIVRGRSFVRQILSRCTVCKRFEGRPYRPPNPPPLPLFRVEEAPPFSYTGVDFAGPLYIKGATDPSSKVWITLFTCCVTRAVHLDLVQELSAPSFLRCLKRFTARRGLPTKIVSDNAKTFKATSRILHAIVSHHDVQRYIAGLGIKWVFNLPKAPWWGGVFERLIKSTKRCLCKIVGRARFTYDELQTAVVEVEAVLNSRPLSYVTTDDIEEPLTPSHLLTGHRILSLPDHLHQGAEEDVGDPGSGPEVLTKRARHLNKVLDRFWVRWRKEYLLELRETHRHHRGHASPSSIAVNDIVIVHSVDQPRGFWRFGRVKELLTGRDGKIRGAVLQVAGKGRQATSLYRPLQLLYPLEASLWTEDSSHDAAVGPPASPNNTSGNPPPSVEQEQESVDVPEPPRRSRRAAAFAARDQLLAQALSDSMDD